MPCTPDVVYEALSWIHTLQTSPGRDLHSALALAFSDPACQSVHLVTSGLPDNPPQCLASVSTLVMRPVNTFYISDKTPMNTDISDFLQCITSITRGSCYDMTLNSAGNVDQVRCWIKVCMVCNTYTVHPVFYFCLFLPFNDLKCQTAQFVAFNGWPDSKAITLRGPMAFSGLQSGPKLQLHKLCLFCTMLVSFFCNSKEWKTEKNTINDYSGAYTGISHNVIIYGVFTGVPLWILLVQYHVYLQG